MDGMDGMDPEEAPLAWSGFCLLRIARAGSVWQRKWVHPLITSQFLAHAPTRDPFSCHALPTPLSWPFG